MTKFSLKPHQYIHLKNHFTLHLKETGEEICTSDSLHHFYEELQKEQPLHEIFMNLRKKNLLTSVKDVALFIRTLHDKRFFDGEKTSKSSLSLTPLKTGLTPSSTVAGLIEILIFSLATLGIILFFNGSRTFDFFTETTGLTAVSSALLWLVIYILTRITLMLLLVRWHCGYYPSVHFGFSKGNLGFLVPVSSLASLPRFRQASVWLAMSISPLAVSALGLFVLKGTVAISMMWLGILFTFKNLNPMKNSDISKFLRVLIGTNDWEHLLPYLKTKSLTAVAQKKVKSVQESRLVAFSSLSVLWIVIFCSLALDIALTNFPRWLTGLQTGGENLLASLISFSLFAFVTVDALVNLWNVLAGNTLGFYSKLFDKKAGTGEKTDWDLTHLKDVMQKSPAFEDLSDAQWEALLQGGQVKAYKAGSLIIKQGGRDDLMYFILKGSCEVSKTLDTGLQLSIAKIQEGAIFGEVALLEKLNRTASVTASEESVFFIIDRSTYEKVWSTSPGISQALKKRIFLSRAMSSSALLKDVPAEISDIFLKKGILENYSPDLPIIREGDSSKDFYIILQGSVNVTQGEKKLAELSAGQFFGEIAMLENSPRMATVTTKEDAIVLRLQVADFWEIISQNIQLALNIEATALQSKNLI